jgi:hypothetical protein
MSELSAENVSAFLNRRTGGFDCSVCGKCEWQMGVSERESDYLKVRCGHCGHIELFDRDFVEQALLPPRNQQFKQGVDASVETDEPSDQDCQCGNQKAFHVKPKLGLFQKIVRSVFHV